MLGLVFADQPVSKVGRDATRLIWLGLALAVISGTLMFVSNARMYYYNPAFELKMLLLIEAVLVQGAVVAQGYCERLANAGSCANECGVVAGLLVRVSAWLPDHRFHLALIRIEGPSPASSGD
ncbi:MAG: hypothetical protein WDO56_12645 [Gammaproteobacteria bacterium]